MEKRTDWNNVANWYDQIAGNKGSDFQQNIIFPGILKMLKIKKDQHYSLLDLCCGQGAFSRYLLDYDIDICGIDQSEILIDIAKNRCQNSKKEKYIVADVNKLLSQEDQLNYNLKENSFDFITIILAIQNIQVLTPVFQTVRKLLKNKGHLVICLMHPCFRIPQYSDWYFDNKKHMQYRMMSKYLISKEISISTNPGKEKIGQKSQTTTHFHRPLRSYINTLGNCHLYVDQIEEFVTNKKEQVGKKSSAIELAKKEFPLFLAIKAIKID